ncbi:hypothetical protein FHS18_005986 [Paenibacillus phyllosphaerae]|uniref:Uncharacterized protein n=1 Tax=Paenibacillus phyllosphaerae TaxID=274593 RepID=A0A7W5B574_9BACL|nr:CBO0543 family protein [Paenibacillus phyllosphaerae]MBB3113871.1 hypothetical protein [Paenibacillus phyllosphaerae]
MLLNRIVLIGCIVLTALLLLLFTPRDKFREVILVFLFKQVLTWPMGVLAVEANWIHYPVREFPNTIKTSFSFEYFIYPAICILFVLRYPKHKPLPYKIGWYLFFPSWMTAAEVLIEHETKLIQYINWSWYLTWLSLIITFRMSHAFYDWYTMRGTVVIGDKQLP